jgi:chitinase
VDYMKKLLLLLLLSMLWPTLALAQQLQWSTGYTFGRNNLDPAIIPWASVTHVSHFALWVANDGSVSGSYLGLTTTASRALTAEAHKNGRKAIICVGGYGNGPGFASATTDANRQKLINNIVNYMSTYGYDGVDLDWEDGMIASQYLALARELRAKLDTITPRPLMTAAVQCWVGASAEIAIIPYTDQANIMSYTVDANGLGSEVDCFVNGGIAKGRLGIGIGLGDGGGVDRTAAAVKAKCDYAKNGGYGGVMQWLIEDDYKANGKTMPWMAVIAPYVSQPPESTNPDAPRNLRVK